MSDTLWGLPAPQIDADLGEAAVTMRLDPTLYPLDVIYAAAYPFIARCWVVLDRDDAGRVAVVLTAKQTATAEQLRALVGEFANELLSAACRREITRQNRALIESVTTQAFGGAMGPPSLEELEAFDFTDEPFEDPLGIAQSWEDKYRKKPQGDGGDHGEGAP
jgi:His-Xaa-Ser system protein HxsD